MDKVSKEAKELIWKIETYIKESSKKEYVFELEEELILTKELEILKKHIEYLSDFELKRKGE